MNGPMAGRRRLVVWIVAGPLVLFACRGPALWRYEDAVDRTPPAAAHAVHEERLAELMRSVDRLRVERLPQALDPRVEQARQAREVERIARAMAESAAEIPDAEPPGLSPAQRADFLALAASLREASTGLADDASRTGPDAWQTRLDEIDATCDRCHGRFRIPEVDAGDG